MIRTQHKHSNPWLRLLLIAMLMAGILRIALIFLGPSSAPSHFDAGPSDAVMFRRSAQVVMVSIGLLAAGHGLVALECREESGKPALNIDACGAVYEYGGWARQLPGAGAPSRRIGESI